MQEMVNQGAVRRKWLISLATLVALIIAAECALAYGNAAAAASNPLTRFLKRVEPGQLAPGADAFGPLQGDPPVIEILHDGQPIGYGFLNSSFVNAAGYSGKPINILIALDLQGRISGLKLVDHKEPIVLVGISEQKITALLDDYIGFDVPAFVASGGAEHDVDIVSGATVTIMVADDSIVRASIKVARLLGLGGLTPEAETRTGPIWEVDQVFDELVDWQTLLGEGAVRRLLLSVADINAAYQESGDAAAAARPESGEPDAAFIDLYVALVTIPSIGRSLLGAAEYANLQKTLKPNQQAILVAADGLYSFKGSGYVRGGIFDRFQVIQGDETLRFRDRDHKRLGEVAAVGAPKFKDVDLFIIPQEYAFDPAQGWRLDLLVQRATGPTAKSFLTFDVGYRPPERYLSKVAEASPAATDPTMPEGALSEGTITDSAPAESRGNSGQSTPLWQRLWQQKVPEIVVLLVALGLLTGIFYVQDWLTKHVRLTDRLRIGFLIFTLFGSGFYANAQLSVVNILTFSNALISGFQWGFFLKDPLIFILWCSVATAILFWGRGAFCGWLCPFGALQELTNKLARLLKIPQVKVPWWLHERLWSIKYIIFLALFGVSFYSLALAEQLAEIEPFKTSIILKFQRHWPFVLFAVALLTAGLFIERFFCRYLCPLGAALAIPGRLRMFDWLKRYRECGNPCQRCSNECMVGAIHPQGQINPNECHSCLHCQTLYHDDRRCPVMIQRRLKRERRQASSPGPIPATARKKSKETLELADFLPERGTTTS